MAAAGCRAVSGGDTASFRLMGFFAAGSGAGGGAGFSVRPAARAGFSAGGAAATGAGAGAGTGAGPGAGTEKQEGLFTSPFYFTVSQTQSRFLKKFPQLAVIHVVRKSLCFACGAKTALRFQQQHETQIKEHGLSMANAAQQMTK